MQKRFYEILDKWGPKHWSFGVRKDAELLNWINEQTVDIPNSVSFAERVYCAITGERPPCPRGSRRRFKSIIDGWGFCGKTGKCECAREQVSQSVSQTKQAETPEQRAVTQKRRETTNLERYGHINSAQTAEARAAHHAFYADAENVRNQLRKQADTMMKLYGVLNAAHIVGSAERREATTQQRHGFKNPMQNASIAARSIAVRLENGYSEAYYRRNYDRMRDRLLHDYEMILLTTYEEYHGVADRPSLKLECANCGRNRTWRVTYTQHREPRCPLCRPPNIVYKSKEEIAIFQFIKEKLMIPDLISGDRELIRPMEIDILSESNRVAIEYGGLYWHSEAQNPDHQYHLEKLKLVESAGLRLLTIFSDEWTDHPDIVKSKICHLFNRIEDRRFARRMQIVEIDGREAKEFYEASHIQGGTNASCNLALYDQNQIVAAMSFITARESKGLPENSYEMVRFATLPYVTVVGGASRLFVHFVRSHSPTAVVSYADRRWSDGGLYHKLGFALEHSNPPSYSYVEGYVKRHFRFNFRKDVLESLIGPTDQTEWEIMRALDYDRIWDCGTYRFVWRAPAN